MYINKILYIAGILLFFSCKETIQRTHKQLSETNNKAETKEKNYIISNSESLPTITTSSNEVIIDSLIFDFNNDKINDKVLIRANPKEESVMGDEYFDNINSYYRTLDVFIGKKNNNYAQISSNKNIIPCLRCNEPMRAYSDFKRIGENSFSIDIIQKAENTIYQLVFERKQDNFYLTQIGMKSFYDENGKTVKLKRNININEVMTKDISEYINHKQTPK